jgi:hypothetical protein
MREQKKSGQKQGTPVPRVAFWRRRLVVAALWLGVAAGAFCYGRFTSIPQASAEAPAPARAAQTKTPSYSSEYSGRIIAYIYGNIPVTREDLADYLIERGGKERAKSLINKKIIEYAARQHNIEITAAEIDIALDSEARSLGVQPRDFVNTILKRYNKSILEWKEDVIKPRLILEKLARPRVSVTREALAQAYEAYYGKKIDCRMIIWPKDELKIVKDQIWPLIRTSDKEFDHYARIQISPSLAAVGGHVKPIGRNTVGNLTVERTLFALRDGEVSEIQDTPEGLVVFKRIGEVAPDTSVNFEQARPQLEKEVFDKSVALEVGKVFHELYEAAKPQNFLEPSGNVAEEVKEHLIQTGTIIEDRKNQLKGAVPVPSAGAMLPTVTQPQ